MSRKGIPACALKVPFEDHVHYRIVDTCIGKPMYHGLCLNEEAHVQRLVSEGPRAEGSPEGAA